MTNKIPEEFVPLTIEFKEKLLKISYLEHEREWGEIYQELGDFISQFDTKLWHVPERNLHLYFDYTDMAEGLLVSCMLRNIKPKNVRPIWVNISNYFESVMLLINTSEDLPDEEFQRLKNGILDIKTRIKEYELDPTVEELDIVISSELEKMSEQEKKELFKQLKGE